MQIHAGESFTVSVDAQWAADDLHQQDLSVVIWGDQSQVAMSTTQCNNPHEGFANYNISDDTIIYDLFGNAIERSDRSDVDGNAIETGETVETGETDEPDVVDPVDVDEDESADNSGYPMAVEPEEPIEEEKDAETPWSF